MENEQKLRALLEGLEARNIDKFMNEAKVIDYRNYGKVYLERCMDLIEDSSKCEDGCVSFCDAPIKHHKDCVNYVEEMRQNPLLVTEEGVEVFKSRGIWSVNKETFE